jgi:hypothetical protein
MADRPQDCPGCGLPGDDPIIETVNDDGARLCHHCGAEWVDPDAPRRPAAAPPGRRRWWTRPR